MVEEEEEPPRVVIVAAYAAALRLLLQTPVLPDGTCEEGDGCGVMWKKVGLRVTLTERQTVVSFFLLLLLL